MATVVTMPKLSDTMEEGAIASWAKKEGDSIEEGELLAEIETDKATMEYESPEDGVLLKIVVKGGAKAEVGAPIAVFGEKGESFDLDALLGKSDKPESKGSEDSKNEGNEKKQAETTGEQQATVRSDKHDSTSSSSNESDTRLRSSPLARKVALDRGIDLSEVKGSGPHGRVVLRDLTDPKSEHAKGRPGTQQKDSATTRSGSSGDEFLSVSMMRKTIAKRLLQGKNEAPHFYLTRSANMARLNEWRQRINEEASSEDQPKVSVNDMIILAAAKALRKHKDVNASWEQDQIRLFGEVNIAMAVALPTGLVTPVLRRSDQMGVRDIARLTKELATKARDGKLSNEDYSGGTFTISNLGMMGIEEFTAIINPPQAAILAVGATIKTPVVTDDDKIIVEPRMKVTLSCDHRVIDGMVGARFLKDFIAYLEDPLMMLT